MTLRRRVFRPDGSAADAAAAAVDAPLQTAAERRQTAGLPPLGRRETPPLDRSLKQPDTARSVIS